MDSLQDQTFLYREVPVQYDGTGTLTSIKGNTISFNQLIQNGNFADSSNWSSYDANKTSISISNNICKVTYLSSATTETFKYGLTQNITPIVGHKYSIIFDFRLSYSGSLSMDNFGNYMSKSAEANTWTKYFTIFTNYVTSAFLVRPIVSVQENDYFEIKNCMVLDLTLMGIDNLTTTAEVESWLSSHLGNIPYFAYTQGSLISFNGTGLKSTNLSAPKSTTIYGIKRELSSSSSTWTRTDGGVNKTANATHDGSSATNDFDSIYPWSEIKTVNLANDGTVNAILGDSSFKWDGSNGEVMTYIPSFWYKRWQDSTYEYMQISQSEFSGASYSKGFYIGRYTTSSGAHSKSGVASQVSTNITNFRTQATAKGTGWQQMDYHYFLLQLLYLVEYADGNSQSKLGQGVCSVSAQVNSGALDSLGMKSGCLANVGATSVIYRGIENIFGNIWQFVDGLNIKDNVAYICYKPSSYQVDKFDGDYSAVGYTNANSNGNPNKMGYDSNNPMVALPVVVGTSVYGDYYWQNTGNRIARVGGFWAVGAFDGLFSWNLSDDSGNSVASIGSRLIYNEENPLLENYSTLSLPISTYFPTGMKSAGKGNSLTYDELTNYKATSRVGTRAYQSGDENDSTLTTDMTYTNYPLTTPTETDISPSLDLTYPIENGGTEQIIPVNSSVPTTSPIICDIDYRTMIPVNATVDPTGSGTISGTGNYRYHSNATLTATPSDEIYRFLRWEDENGTMLSTEATYTFEVGE